MIDKEATSHFNFTQGTCEKRCAFTKPQTEIPQSASHRLQSQATAITRERKHVQEWQKYNNYRQLLEVLFMSTHHHLPSEHADVIFFLPLSLQEQRDILHNLRQAAFETESENSLSHERRRSLCAKEFKKLGFSVCVCCQSWSCNYLLTTHVICPINSHLCNNIVLLISFQNNSNPGQDLVRTPPGLLALDTMFYFAVRFPNAYSRVSMIYISLSYFILCFL